jgi:hypothetical protein
MDHFVKWLVIRPQSSGAWYGERYHFVYFEISHDALALASLTTAKKRTFQ